jgi:hypothetical protein
MTASTATVGARCGHRTGVQPIHIRPEFGLPGRVVKQEPETIGVFGSRTQ